MFNHALWRAVSLQLQCMPVYINCIELFTLFRAVRPKPVPCLVALPCIGHVHVREHLTPSLQLPPFPPLRAHSTECHLNLNKTSPLNFGMTQKWGLALVTWNIINNIIQAKWLQSESKILGYTTYVLICCIHCTLDCLQMRFASSLCRPPWFVSLFIWFSFYSRWCIPHGWRQWTRAKWVAQKQAFYNLYKSEKIH